MSCAKSVHAPWRGSIAFVRRDIAEQHVVEGRQGLFLETPRGSYTMNTTQLARTFLLLFGAHAEIPRDKGARRNMLKVKRTSCRRDASLRGHSGQRPGDKGKMATCCSRLVASERIFITAPRCAGYIQVVNVERYTPRHSSRSGGFGVAAEARCPFVSTKSRWIRTGEVESMQLQFLYIRPGTGVDGRDAGSVVSRASVGHGAGRNAHKNSG